MKYTYTTVRSNRRTVALQIKEGQLIVRAPLRMSDAQIELFVSQHEQWIERNMLAAAKRQEQYADVEPLTPSELRELAEAAVRVIPQRVSYYASLMGVSYGRITIRSQRSRWGSCSSKGNLNFNCLLMLAPPEVLDSVIVHELCHLKQMNHSQKFYDEVLKVYPQYHECNAWLKQHGEALMRRSKTSTSE